MTEFLSDTCFTRRHRVRNARYNSCDDVRFALDHYAWIVFVLATVHGHKYSSPSIFYYIFHIKPHFFKKIFQSYFWADFYEIYLTKRRNL